VAIPETITNRPRNGGLRWWPLKAKKGDLTIMESSFKASGAKISKDFCLCGIHFNDFSYH
jgi:hypothetical protein